MSVQDDFCEILDYAHFWNWAPDWDVVREIYTNVPTSYSVLTPFAYSYLEEMIRSTTSEYSMPLYMRDGTPVTIKRGNALIDLAIKENHENAEYVELLEQIRGYFKSIKDTANSNSRNKVMHGRVHPRFWSKESFEQLIHDIALLSKHSKF